MILEQKKSTNSNFWMQEKSIVPGLSNDANFCYFVFQSDGTVYSSQNKGALSIMNTFLQEYCKNNFVLYQGGHCKNTFYNDLNRGDNRKGTLLNHLAIKTWHRQLSGSISIKAVSNVIDFIPKIIESLCSFVKFTDATQFNQAVFEKLANNWNQCSIAFSEDILKMSMLLAGFTYDIDTNYDASVNTIRSIYYDKRIDKFIGLNYLPMYGFLEHNGNEYIKIPCHVGYCLAYVEFCEEGPIVRRFEFGGTREFVKFVTELIKGNGNDEEKSEAKKYFNEKLKIKSHNYKKIIKINYKIILRFLNPFQAQEDKALLRHVTRNIPEEKIGIHNDIYNISQGNKTTYEKLVALQKCLAEKMLLGEKARRHQYQQLFKKICEHLFIDIKDIIEQCILLQTLSNDSWGEWIMSTGAFLIHNKKTYYVPATIKKIWLKLQSSRDIALITQLVNKKLLELRDKKTRKNNVAKKLKKLLQFEKKRAIQYGFYQTVVELTKLEGQFLQKNKSQPIINTNIKFNRDSYRCIMVPDDIVDSCNNKIQALKKKGYFYIAKNKKNKVDKKFNRRCGFHISPYGSISDWFEVLGLGNRKTGGVSELEKETLLKKNKRFQQITGFTDNVWKFLNRCCYQDIAPFSQEILEDYLVRSVTQEKTTFTPKDLLNKGVADTLINGIFEKNKVKNCRAKKNIKFLQEIAKNKHAKLTGFERIFCKKTVPQLTAIQVPQSTVKNYIKFDERLKRFLWIVVAEYKQLIFHHVLDNTPPQTKSIRQGLFVTYWTFPQNSLSDCPGLKLARIELVGDEQYLKFCSAAVQGGTASQKEINNFLLDSEIKNSECSQQIIQFKNIYDIYSRREKNFIEILNKLIAFVIKKTEKKNSVEVYLVKENINIIQWSLLSLLSNARDKLQFCQQNKQLKILQHDIFSALIAEPVVKNNKKFLSLLRNFF
ncbi:MAG: hypothetical protein JKY13_03910 [Gammaproteobacteria bacterium]|nr:hypothetical protein [Gammaproteobacteria bacterium]